MEDSSEKITPDNGKRAQHKNRLEINNTVVLAIATLAVTWCSYQSVLWNGVQTFKLADVNKYTRQAQEISITLEQHKVMDADLIRDFVSDVWERREDKINFYMRRIRPEMATILQAWLDIKPLDNTKAPPHPMAMEQYKQLIHEDVVKVEEFKRKSEASAHDAQHANMHSDNYSLYTVVFSMAMFLGAIASKVSNIKITVAFIVLSGLICLLALVFLFTTMPLASRS